MTSQELRRLARLGAEARLAALEREMAAIYQVFPELRGGRSTATSNPYTAGVRSAVEGAVTRRRRPRMSREARKRIAEAQRKRWEAWRAKNGKAAEEGPKETAPSKPKPKASSGSRKKK